MRVVIGVAIITITGAVFTLLTAVIVVTEHPFASAVLASLTAAGLVAATRRRRTRRAQPGSTYPAPVAGPLRWTAAEMSSAFAPRRCLP